MLANDTIRIVEEAMMQSVVAASLRPRYMFGEFLSGLEVLAPWHAAPLLLPA
jgi:hypothetical protein